jgi:hypothetical protein
MNLQKFYFYNVFITFSAFYIPMLYLSHDIGYIYSEFAETLR